MYFKTVTKDQKLFSPGDKVKTKVFGLYSTIEDVQIAQAGEGDFFVSYYLKDIDTTFRWRHDDLELLLD